MATFIYYVQENKHLLILIKLHNMFETPRLSGMCHLMGEKKFTIGSFRWNASKEMLIE